jgi:hypothetical protein
MYITSYAALLQYPNVNVAMISDVPFTCMLHTASDYPHVCSCLGQRKDASVFNMCIQVLHTKGRGLAIIATPCYARYAILIQARHGT